MTVGVLALAVAGGGAGLVGGNGGFAAAPGGAPAVAGPAVSHRPEAAGAAGGAARSEGVDRVPAPSGKAGTGPRPGAEAQPREREIRKTPQPAPTATPGTVEPGRVEAGQVEPGLVEGIIASGERPPNDSAGFKADGPSRHTDRRAAEYFRTHWGAGDKAMKRLKEIRTVGGYLRIYTDLPETADNSRHAITLCKRGLEYLRAAGVADPVVFVHSEFGGNGNPVLANVLGPDDHDCRVTHPPPD
ncbi:hypothetical protein ABGB18_09765 [Nonomuraea sp. B12E4]|uniref:hypothetical protein n=1 Tax=Nonomuraea sp. B12E4 TaxID=3153564 RepID=UPI00325DFC00